MVKGSLGVHNKTIYLEDSFNSMEDYQVNYAKTIEDREKVKYLEVVFDNSEMKNQFLLSNEDSGLKIIYELDNRLLIKK